MPCMQVIFWTNNARRQVGHPPLLLHLLLSLLPPLQLLLVMDGIVLAISQPFS